MNYEVIIDNNILDKYEEYYFTIHPRAKKRPFINPYHESINTWMIKRRPAMNALKQKWKDFIKWLVEYYGYSELHIDKCEVSQTVYYKSARRHDIDNSVPKFILDGLVDSGMIADDDYKHITKLTLECGVDIDNPRTIINVKVLDE